MWPGGTLHVVVGTLKISLDRLLKKKDFSRGCSVKIALKQTLTSKLGVTLVLAVTLVNVFVNLRPVTAVPP